MAHTWPGKKKTAFCCLPLMQFHATCNKILKRTKCTPLFTTEVRFIIISQLLKAHLAPVGKGCFLCKSVFVNLAFKICLYNLFVTLPQKHLN